MMVSRRSKSDELQGHYEPATTLLVRQMTAPAKRLSNQPCRLLQPMLDLRAVDGLALAHSLRICRI